ncbi:MAG: type II toxin-antitoxin system VapC family toxin [Candidatus Limnocylindria bacterium]
MVLDTSVLVYAVGAEHPQASPCRRLLKAVGDRELEATTTVEVVQEFVHVRARRWERGDAAQLGRRFAQLLSPLLEVRMRDLEDGLLLFERHPELGSFDCVLAATALGRQARFVSADKAFSTVAGLDHIDPATPAFQALIGDLQG